MYSKQEAALIRKKFWTSFGKYMQPLQSADGEAINWLNYKTGIRHLYFRMDVDNTKASIAIELRHTDIVLQQQYFEQLQSVKGMLEKQTGEKWKWEFNRPDDDGNTVSRISSELTGINLFVKEDWSAIISFLKPRIMALDKFWSIVKPGFE